MNRRARYILLSLLLLLSAPQAAFAASLYLDPESGTYGPGDTFIATVRIDNESDCVNAINVGLSYSTDSLRAVDFSRGDSIFSLWAVEPTIDTGKGTVVFAGGIPGGYCGRIAGDPALSNILGKVVFTVISANTARASIQFAPASAVFLNDGKGTAAKLSTHGETITLSPTPLETENPWLSEVGADTTPPQPFVVDVESTQGVFNGKYYIVFSTTDKESGMDHFEIFEHGGWKRIISPYLPGDQSLLGVGDIQVRAIDKAGNIRLGTNSTASSIPQRQFSSDDFIPLIIFVLVILLVGSKVLYDHKKFRSSVPPR